MCPKQTRIDCYGNHNKNYYKFNWTHNPSAIARVIVDSLFMFVAAFADNVASVVAFIGIFLSTFKQSC